MIYVFTGRGKGKTTASLGMALRALGAGRKVVLVQFLKTAGSSELKAIENLPGFKAKAFGRPGFFLPQKELVKNPALKAKGVKPLKEEDKKLAREAFQFAREKAGQGSCQFLILDEINPALSFGLLDLQEVLPFLEKYGRIKDIVLTGRQAPGEIIAIADLATQCREIKHYYQKGQRAKKGIEL